VTEGGLRELLREAIETVHQTGSIRDHSDPSDKTGWNVHGIETCADPLCEEAHNALAAPSRDAGLDVERLARAITNVDSGPGWDVLDGDRESATNYAAEYARLSPIDQPEAE
jgi:hypothetical protein